MSASQVVPDVQQPQADQSAANRDAYLQFLLQRADTAASQSQPNPFPQDVLEAGLPSGPIPTLAPQQPEQRGGLKHALSQMAHNFLSGAQEAGQEASGINDAELKKAQTAHYKIADDETRQRINLMNSTIPVSMPDGSTWHVPANMAKEAVAAAVRGQYGIGKQRVVNEGALDNTAARRTPQQQLGQQYLDLLNSGDELGAAAVLDHLTKLGSAQRTAPIQHKAQFESIVGGLIDRGEVSPQHAMSNPSVLMDTINRSPSLSPEDRVFALGYLTANNTPASVNAAGVNRAYAYGGAKYVKVVDPANPGNVKYMRAAAADAGGFSADTSGFASASRAMDKYFTSGKGGQTLNAFNTASSHLDTLGDLAVALHNGDLQAVNHVSQAYSRQTGIAAPTNFETAKAAVAGEIAATFKSSGATDSEIKTIVAPLETAESPEQLLGAIGTFRDLLESKRHALEGQYHSGRQGQPAFPNSTPHNSNPNPKPFNSSFWSNKPLAVK